LKKRACIRTLGLEKTTRKEKLARGERQKVRIGASEEKGDVASIDKEEDKEYKSVARPQNDQKKEKSEEKKTLL